MNSCPLKQICVIDDFNEVIMDWWLQLTVRQLDIVGYARMIDWNE
jgi:hypothetical protein